MYGSDLSFSALFLNRKREPGIAIHVEEGYSIKPDTKTRRKLGRNEEQEGRGIKVQEINITVSES